MSTPQLSPLVAQEVAAVQARFAALKQDDRLTDDEVESIYDEGYQLAVAGRIEEGLQHVTMASTFRPRELRYIRGRAVLLGKLGQHAQAMALYRALDGLEPFNPANLFGMVESALGMNLSRLAGNLLDQFIQYAERTKRNPTELDKARALRAMLNSRKEGADAS